LDHALARGFLRTHAYKTIGKNGRWSEIAASDAGERFAHSHSARNAAQGKAYLLPWARICNLLGNVTFFAGIGFAKGSHETLSSMWSAGAP